MNNNNIWNIVLGTDDQWSVKFNIISKRCTETRWQDHFNGTCDNVPVGFVCILCIWSVKIRCLYKYYGWVTGNLDSSMFMLTLDNQKNRLQKIGSITNIFVIVPLFKLLLFEPNEEREGGTERERERTSEWESKLQLRLEFNIEFNRKRMIRMRHKCKMCLPHW